VAVPMSWLSAKNETEVMFIVTAQIVKPVNRDDIPTMRGIDGLKNGSPLGLEPKGEGISGQTGYKVTGQNEAAPKAVEPAKKAEPKTTTDTNATSTTSSSTSSVRVMNPMLPPATVAKLELN